MSDKKDDKKDDKVFDLAEKLKKRADELGIKEDTEEEKEERKKKRLEFLENKVAHGLPQWEMVGEPQLAGENFVVARSWHREIIANDKKYSTRKLIQVDPGVAFGSSHPTTLTCIEAIEKYYQGGSFLDIGTGTGILAIAAAMLYPKASIDAFDISQDIMEHAALHLKINEIPNVNLRQGTIGDYVGKTYDLVMANLLPDLLNMLKVEIIDKVKPNGLLVLSGFAEKHHGRTFASFDWVPTVSEGMDAVDVEKMFLDLGMSLVEKRQTGEWVALVMKKAEGN